MTHLELKKTLTSIAEKEAGTKIEGFIAYDALNYDPEDCSTYIKNLLNPETSMSMMFQFFEYSDVDDFYQTYKNDILKKQKQFGITHNDLLKFKGHAITNLCWIVIEETANQMAKELELEI
ncbi:hypothetical protein [uncultured Winogradskyella sp.]|uniref:hypothetical protein n=1 Tax=uncultured Winogradskyella sp. TaxID=395353 RepID=UPI002601DE24|nr:hypothetical protein [uncultured Winogradskyella sp.]